MAGVRYPEFIACWTFASAARGVVAGRAVALFQQIGHGLDGHIARRIGRRLRVDCGQDRIRIGGFVQAEGCGDARKIGGGGVLKWIGHGHLLFGKGSQGEVGAVD
ncbi:MAG: hypothetical protein ACU0BE_12050, partial [Paracoccus sp. (in: a-proteobacteria)]